MKIAIYGTGGVGGYFGGRLAQAGADVAFIARGAHMDAMQSRGLRVDSIEGDFFLPSIETTDNPKNVGIVDAVLLGVKAWQVPEAALAIKPMMGPDTFVVPLQNGVDAPSQLSSVLGKNAVLGGLCRILSSISGPGHIQHAGIYPFITFGELDNSISDRCQKLFQLFSKATGVEAVISQNITVDIWRKFLLISAFSGVGAVTQAPIGIVRSQQEAREMLEKVMVEIFNVAQAKNILLPSDVIASTMKFFDNLPPEGTASMQRDIQEGRPSELLAQNGAAVRFGKETNIDTPVNSFIYASLLPSELRARGKLNF